MEKKLEKKINDFWNWFVMNEKKLKTAFNQYLDRNQSVILEDFTPLMRELNLRLANVAEGLSYEFSGQEKEGRFEIVITANGHTPSFVGVFELVKSTPKLNDFFFTALRQAASMEEVKGWELQAPGVKVSVSDTYFTFILNTTTNKVDCHFYIKGFNGNLEKYADMLLVLLDRVIGEFNVATRIGLIDISRLRFAKVSEYTPLSDMPVVFDEIFGKGNN